MTDRMTRVRSKFNCGLISKLTNQP